MKNKVFLTLLYSCCPLLSLLSEGVLPMPSFSHPHGIYDQPFKLSIQCDSSRSLLYYTTDGSLPSATNGTRYTQPLSIESTAIIRAIALPEENPEKTNDSEIATATYLFLESVLKQNNTPEGYPAEWGKYATRSGTAKADYEMDPEVVNDKTRREKVLEGFRSIPIVSLVTDKNHFFNKVEDDSLGGIYIYTGAPAGAGTGRGWERPVSFELFDAQGRHDLQVNCGVKIHGGHSRVPEKSPKHSLRLVFRENFGPTKLRYPLFGPEEPNKFNAIVLRTAFCNSWTHQDNSARKIALYTRDMWAKRTQKAMGHLTTNGMYAHLFINGLYWGLYNPTERIDDDFCEAHLGGKKEDYDVIKVEEYGSKHTIEAGNGTLEKWNELLTLAATADNNESFRKIQGLDSEGKESNTFEPLLDVENLIDYMIINQYGGNTDWDHHNWLAVRSRITPGKGFNILCWDSEHILKTLEENVLAENNAQCPSYLFQQLMKNTLFKRWFMDRVQTHCYNNGLLTPKQATNTFHQLCAILETALYDESARWGDYRRDVHPYSTKGELYLKEKQYEEQRTFMLETYFPNRTEAYLSQLREKEWFPTTEAPTFWVDELQAFQTDTLRKEDGVLLKGVGEIYYTLNGENPVDWETQSNGTLSGKAIRYTGETISCTSSFTLKAVCKRNSQWSAVSQQHFFVAPTVPDALQNPSLPDFQFTYTPNPTHGGNLNYQLKSSSQVSLQIYNLQGKVLVSLYERQNAGTQNIDLARYALPGRVYVCRLCVEGAPTILKIAL